MLLTASRVYLRDLDRYNVPKRGKVAFLLSWSYRAWNHCTKKLIWWKLYTCLRLYSSRAGCSSLGDLLLRSSQLGIPLRDLLRLVPVFLGSASGQHTLLGFPLQAFWSWFSELVNGLVTSQRNTSKPYTASACGTDFLPVTAANRCSTWDKMWALDIFCLNAAWLPWMEKNWLFPSQPLGNEITKVIIFVTYLYLGCFFMV